MQPTPFTLSVHVGRAFLAIAVFSALMTYSSGAEAQIVVQEVVRYIKPKQRPVENILVKNVDATRAFTITSEIVKEENSGTDARTQEPSKDMVVAPPSFTIKPGETILTRLVLTKPADKDMERIYRVRFKPETLKADDTPTEVSGVKTQISFVTTTGMLVLVSPQNPQPKLTYTRNGEGITFKNEGNVTIDLRRFDNYCFDEAQTDCMDLPGYRLYPGNDWRVEIPGDKQVRYNYAVYDDFQSIVVDAAQ